MCFFYGKAQKFLKLVPVPEETEILKSAEGKGCEYGLLAHYGENQFVSELFWGKVRKCSTQISK